MVGLAMQHAYQKRFRQAEQVGRYGVGGTEMIYANARNTAPFLVRQVCRHCAAASRQRLVDM